METINSKDYLQGQLNLYNYIVDPNTAIFTGCGLSALSDACRAVLLIYLGNNNKTDYIMR